MRLYSVKLTASIVALGALTMTVNARPLVLTTPRIQVDQKFYMGFHCHLADGSAKTVVRTLAAILKIALPKELIDQGIDQVALSKGDAYCVWLHVDRPRWNLFRKSRIRATTSYQFKIYGAEGKVVAQKVGTCENHSHCWTNVVKGTDKSAGFAGCFEPQLAGGKKASIVIVHGTVPTKLSQTSGSKAAKTCAERQSELSAEG